MKVAQSCPTLRHHGLYSLWNSPGQNTGVGSLSLLQGIKPRPPTLQADSLPAETQGKPKNTGVGSLYLLQWIFPTQELNQGLLHCGQILYQLSYQESPRVRCKNTTSQTQLSQGFLLMETFTCHSWNSTNVYIFQKLCTFG